MVRLTLPHQRQCTKLSTWCFFFIYFFFQSSQQPWELVPISHLYPMRQLEFRKLDGTSAGNSRARPWTLMPWHYSGWSLYQYIWELHIQLYSKGLKRSNFPFCKILTLRKKLVTMLDALNDGPRESMWPHALWTHSWFRVSRLVRNQDHTVWLMVL